jgi:hypothetical protein
VVRFEDQTERFERINECGQKSVDYAATLKAGVTWVAKFWPYKSWATAAARNRQDTLRHERVHLKIARYVAERATKEIPLTKLRATAGGDGAARIALSRLIGSVHQKLLGVLAAVQSSYDGSTDHGNLAGPQGGWESGYKKAVDDILQALPAWRELLAYAARLSG